MNACRFVCFCLSLFLPVWLPCRAAEHHPKGWDGFMPEAFKIPEAVVLERNPLRGSGRTVVSAGVGLGARNLVSARLAEQLRRGVRGMVVSAEHPCLLFGSRIVSIGQTLELPVEDQGGRRVLVLRLRSVSREQVGFLADEAGARMLGSEQWTCALRPEAVP